MRIVGYLLKNNYVLNKYNRKNAFASYVKFLSWRFHFGFTSIPIGTISCIATSGSMKFKQLTPDNVVAFVFAFIFAFVFMIVSLLVVFLCCTHCLRLGIRLLLCQSHRHLCRSNLRRRLLSKSNSSSLKFKFMICLLDL